MEELGQRELAIDAEGVAAGHGGPRARLAVEARRPAAELGKGERFQP
jgi:hypothetical protein